MSDSASLESAPLLPNEQEQVEMALNRDVRLKHSLVYGLFTGPAVWLAQFGAIGSVLILWRILYQNPAGLFTYHPSAQSAAILLFTEGVLVLQPTATAGAKKAGLKLHQIFQATALPILLFGSFMIWYNKAVHGAKHITSWHATFGVLTLTLLLLQIVFGAVVVYAPLQRLVGGEAKAKALWKYHRLSGYTTLTLAFVTPALAIGWSDWVVGHSTRTERVLMLSGLGLSFVGVLARVRVSKLGIRGGSRQ